MESLYAQIPCAYEKEKRRKKQKKKRKGEITQAKGKGEKT